MDPSELTLRDGTPLARDYMIVNHFDDPARILAIRDAIHCLDDLATVSRHDLDAHLSIPLSSREAAALFTCLQKNGAAVQVVVSEREYADYSFELDREESSSVLDQQAVVLDATRSDSETADDAIETSFVATLPQGFEASSTSVRSLPRILSTIRTRLFDAEKTVRVANPYFDPTLELVDDLAGLPRRGIQTRILTRETAEGGDDRCETLNRMWEQIEPDSKSNLEVRDLYESDAETGAHTYATHAKMVVVDGAFCYVGSANLTGTSLSSNFEFGVLVEGSVVEEAVQTFDEIFEYARGVEFPL